MDAYDEYLEVEAKAVTFVMSAYSKRPFSLHDSILCLIIYGEVISGERKDVDSVSKLEFIIHKPTSKSLRRKIKDTIKLKQRLIRDDEQVHFTAV